jgi:hypothetical protein
MLDPLFLQTYAALDKGLLKAADRDLTYLRIELHICNSERYRNKQNEAI